MSDTALFELADRVGFSCVWHDVFGTEHHATPDTLRVLLAALGFDADSESTCHDGITQLEVEAQTTPAFITAQSNADITLTGVPAPIRIDYDDGSMSAGFAEDAGYGRIRIAGIARPGYHRLYVNDRIVELAIAPARAFTIANALQKRDRSGKAWGLAVQVYGLRRDNDGGIGDFAALADFARAAGHHGADAVAISPVHALYASDPGHYSPYSPSSRIALNPVYAPVNYPIELPAPGDLIDWRTATPARYRALREAFARDHDDPIFQAFQNAAPEVIRRHALFEVMSAHQLKTGAERDWRHWPEALRFPSNAEVVRFADQNQDEIAFHLYAQWRALSGLRNAQAAAIESGMAIGLIADLAVGVDPAGSDAWSRPNEVLRGVSVGAPPDEFNRRGQNWGLTSFSPRGLRRSGFSALRDMLGAALEPTGGVRIDHAMGLARLWLIPDGADANEGCYLRFPYDDMRRLAMLESARHQGIILAEDLGTVPGGFRESLAHNGISGMSVLWFERNGDRFTSPAHWRRETVAMTTTHDLPTAAGWWRGTDIAWRNRLGLAGEDSEKRAHDRKCLWSACKDAGVASGDMPALEDGDAIADTVIAHVAMAQSDLVILPLEDALALDQQPNIPGTIDEHPNWRRRLSSDSVTSLDEPRVAARLAMLDRARKKPL